MAENKKNGYSKISYALITVLAMVAIVMPIFAVAFNFLSVTSLKLNGTMAITSVSVPIVTALSVISLVIAIAAFVALVFSIVVCNNEKLSFFVMWIATTSAFVSSLLYLIATFVATGANEFVSAAASVMAFIITLVATVAFFAVATFTHKERRAKFIHAVWDIFLVKWIWKGFFVNIVYGKFDKYKGWIYLLPALVLLAVFTVWPIFNTVRLAFLQYYDETGAIKPYSLMAELGMIKEYGSASFHIGLESFKQVLGYKDFGLTLLNTVLLCVLTVPVSTLLALLIAVALNTPSRKLKPKITDFMPGRSFPSPSIRRNATMYATTISAIWIVSLSMLSCIGISL